MNKTITIYELLGLVKDGEAPKKIKYDGDKYTYNDCKDYEIDSSNYNLFETTTATFILNDTVEIIEDNDKLENIITFYDDIIEEYVAETKINSIKIKEHYGNTFEQMIIGKINELIDHINKIEEKLD